MIESGKCRGTPGEGLNRPDNFEVFGELIIQVCGEKLTDILLMVVMEKIT